MDEARGIPIRVVLDPISNLSHCRVGNEKVKSGLVSD